MGNGINADHKKAPCTEYDSDPQGSAAKFLIHVFPFSSVLSYVFCFSFQNNHQVSLILCACSKFSALEKDGKLPRNANIVLVTLHSFPAHQLLKNLPLSPRAISSLQQHAYPASSSRIHSVTPRQAPGCTDEHTPLMTERKELQLNEIFDQGFQSLYLLSPSK